MVSFQCDGCSDVIKKPKLDQHRGRCGAPFTCLDCSKTFPTPADYKGHTSCISEAEKYEKSVYQGSPQGNGQGRGGFQQNRGRNQHQSRFGQGGGNYQRGGGVYRATGANGTPLGMSPKIWSHSPPSGEPSSENDMASEKRKHAQEALHMQEDPQPSKRIKLDEPVTVSPTLIIDDALSRIGETNEHKEDKRDKKDKKDKDKKDKRDKKRKGKEPEKDKQWTPSEAPEQRLQSENASETAVEHDAPELTSRRKSKRKDEIAEERKARKEEKKRRKSAAAVDLQGENLSEDDTSTKKKTQHPKRSNEKVVHVELQEPLASSDIEMRDADVEESSNTTTVSVAVESDDRKHQKKQKKERSKEEKKEKKERSKEEKKKEKERSKQEKKERKRAKEVTA